MLPVFPQDVVLKNKTFTPPKHLLHWNYRCCFLTTSLHSCTHSNTQQRQITPVEKIVKFKIYESMNQPVCLCISISLQLFTEFINSTTTIWNVLKDFCHDYNGIKENVLHQPISKRKCGKGTFVGSKLCDSIVAVPEQSPSMWFWNTQ